jgi:hypothetical protein
MVNGKVILPEHEVKFSEKVNESKGSLSDIMKKIEYLERNDKKKQTL